MATRYVRRSDALLPGESSRAKAVPIFVDSDTETLKFGTGSSGTSTKEVVDSTSTQTITGKTMAAQEVVTDYAGDGAITIQPGVASISKGSAAAMTLAAPTAAQAGTFITITSRTAFAHVVTATSLVGDGVSGSPHTTMTFAAFIGASIMLVACNLIWNEVAAKGVTVT